MSPRGTKALKANKTKNLVRRQKAKAKKQEEAKPEEQKDMYPSDYNRDNILFKANYVDSLYGLRMILQKDGRKRGLWIVLEEESMTRIRADAHWRDEGLKTLLPELRKLFARKKKVTTGELGWALRGHLSFFFDHRTEGTGMRLTWSQVRKFIAALTAREKEEKHKTEDWEFEENSDE